VWIFFIFWPGKIHVSPIGVVSSLSPLQCHLSFGRCCHAAASCHASFPWSLDELVASTSSFSNASSCRLPSRVETEALNPHHRRWPPAPNRPTLTLHCYKNAISTLTTLSTTQPHLYFVSSLPRAPRHQSSTRRCHSLSPLYHAHYPSTQRQPQWWTRWPSFASWTTYRHVNSRKKIFWNHAALRRVIN
jgi:hypothetical protein